MRANALVSRMGKGLLAVNIAAVLRVLLHGSDTFRQRLLKAYAAIDPFDLDDSARLAASIHLQMIPEVPFHHLVCKCSAINLDGGVRYVDGFLNWVDLVSLLAIAHDRQPRTMFEIGTYFGYTARVLALNFPESVIHTIDLPVSYDRQHDDAPIPKDDFHLIRERRVGEAFRSDPSIRNIVQHYGDTANWDFQQVKDATLFFIDGSHTYEYARNDTEKCLALCKGRKATLLWHDCDVGHPGLVRYLSELVRAGFPVKHITDTHMAILDC